MLNDKQAERIIAKAEQKNVARADRPDFDFSHILEDFFADHSFAGQRVLDIGPGQYDFARMIRARGGLCDNLDRDPAVLELGEYLGFRIIDADLMKFNPLDFSAEYSGIFCKGSINAHWYGSPAGVAEFAKKLDSMIKPGGWGWFAPWNGRGKRDDPGPCEARESAQRAAFAACGWSAYEPGDNAAAYYGIGYVVARRILYLKNVPPSYRLINDAAPPRQATNAESRPGAGKQALRGDNARTGGDERALRHHATLKHLGIEGLRRIRKAGSSLRSRLR